MVWGVAGQAIELGRSAASHNFVCKKGTLPVYLRKDQRNYEYKHLGRGIKTDQARKIELARFLFEEIANEEADDDLDLSDEQKADLDQAMIEIENDSVNFCSGEEFSKEIKERYGITVSLP